MKKKPIIYAGLLSGLLCFCLGAALSPKLFPIEKTDVEHAAKLIAMEFTPAQTDSMLSMLTDQEKNYMNMRKTDLPNRVPPAFGFNPVPVGKVFDKTRKVFHTVDYSRTQMPANMNDLAWYSVGELSALIHSKKISSVRLTTFFLERLRKYGPMLHCVVTYTDSLAMAQARQADAELASGHDRGLLHGIPYGIKDMFYTRKYLTTFGTPPYRKQLVDEDATVVQKLRDAGAVLVAKLSLGELAMDDVWFGGLTRNPWDTAKGSSGSSAGPASAVSAGLLPFAIGSETWGSIVSPSTVCGVTGLRPTYGRVSRYGAMALSWTMDKVGPISRSTEDCAIVFNAICGPDGKDQSVLDYPFNYFPDVNLSGLRIGFFPKEFDRDTSINKPFNQAAIDRLKQMGAQLVPLDLPDFPYNEMSIILTAEASAAFDELTLSHRDDQMVQQRKDRWPNIFRAGHFIPATEYIRANRLRYLLVQEMDKMMNRVDICIAPSLAGDNLLVTNLSGHPSVVLPNGFINPKTPTSIVFIGQLFGEARLLAIAKKYQDATGWLTRHPPMFK
jgi:Asp-tRNA(Asn)/Glu-tRNA(Gln) amidotransferase A subunit family amidase